MKHITTQRIRQFLLGLPGRAETEVPFHEWAVPIGVHLMPQCPECLQAVHEAFAQWRGLARDDPRVARDAFEFLYRRGIPAEDLTRQARLDADELLRMSPTERRHRLAGEDVRFRAPALVDELLARCEARLPGKPHRALDLAKLALEVSLRTEPAVVGSLAFHARTRAAAHFGNSLRLCDKPQAAVVTFEKARAHFELIAHADSVVEAELQLLEASLAIDQRRFEKAEALLSRALDLYRELGDEHALGLTHLKRAHAAYQQGEPGAGLADLHAAASCLDAEEHTHHLVMIRFNLALYAVEAGDVEQARRYYQDHRELLESEPAPWFALRLVWLRAKMARAGGDTDEARELYGRAREGFVAEGMGYDAALVSLELALLHLEEGDLEAVRALAGEMLPIFHSQDVHREALAALALFRHAVYAEELSTDLAAALHRYLQLAQRDPRLTFQAFRSAD